MTLGAPAELVAALNRHRLGPVLHAERVPGSVANQDYRVRTGRTEVIAKLGDRFELAAEAWACERVRRAGVSAPEVIGFEAGPPELTSALLLLRCFPGRPVEGAAGPVLVEAGRQLRLAHTIALDGFGRLAGAGEPAAGQERQGPAPSWDRVMHAVLPVLEHLVAAGVLDRPLADRVAEAVSDHSGLLAYEGPGVLLHGDLKLEHVFADRGRFVGLIDWGDVLSGDPLFDLARFSMAGPEALAALARGYELEPEPEHRARSALYRISWNVSALGYELDAGGDWFATYRGRVEADLRELER